MTANAYLPAAAIPDSHVEAPEALLLEAVQAGGEGIAGLASVP